MNGQKILNLYAGLGGNRKDWPAGCRVTAVERDAEIAGLYARFNPGDEVVVADAHEYLEKHYLDGWDFIWSSPPCQSHSKIRMMASKSGSYASVMPDMNLWAEILFLRAFAKCPWCVENVRPYYRPLVEPTVEIHRHLFWTNYPVSQMEFADELSHNARGSSKTGVFDLRGIPTVGRKDQMIRNSVPPAIGLHLLKAAFGGEA